MGKWLLVVNGVPSLLLLGMAGLVAWSSWDVGDVAGGIIAAWLVWLAWCVWKLGVASWRLEEERRRYEAEHPDVFR